MLGCKTLPPSHRRTPHPLHGGQRICHHLSPLVSLCWHHFTDKQWLPDQRQRAGAGIITWRRNSVLGATRFSGCLSRVRTLARQGTGALVANRCPELLLFRSARSLPAEVSMRDIPGIQSQSTTPKFEPLFCGCAKTGLRQHNTIMGWPDTLRLHWSCGLASRKRSNSQ